MSVRRATSADGGCGGVVCAVYAEHGFAWDAGGYHADLEDVAASFDGFWVDERDRQIVGCVGIRSAALLLDGSDCSPERLYVLPERRGGGAGSALLEAALTCARELGDVRMEIWSDKLLTDAHRLYERQWRQGRVRRASDACVETTQAGLEAFGRSGGRALEQTRSPQNRRVAHPRLC